MLRRTLLIAATAWLAAAPLAAQLRPYGPVDWAVFDGSPRMAASIGSAILWNQRASLAGTQGRLVEFGTVRAAVRTGRVVVETAGTIFRTFREDSTFAPATGGAENRPLGRRSDVGDYTVATTILLSDPARPAAAILRFGSRLPTTDNRVGLERDAIDFFATVGGRLDFASIRATTELGLGIHGTRLEDFEQADVLIYSASITARSVPLKPAILLLGQVDALDWSIRGNEQLSEARFVLRSSGNVWLQAEAIKGFERFSPGMGISVSVGTIL
jgi:hypothetical protein